MDILDQLQAIFEEQGFDYERYDRQFAFISSCSGFNTTFRIFQNGFLVMLVGGTGFRVPEGRRSAAGEFCAIANFALMPFGNLEMDSVDGHILFRHSLMIPEKAELGVDQLKWFLVSAVRLLTDLCKPLLWVALTETEPKVVLNETREVLYPEQSRANDSVRVEIPIAGAPGEA